ncbi:MAG: thiamine phosphate synthase, partial [Candidatus Omnitrophota bacterium]
MRIKGYYFITDKKLSRKGNASDLKNAILAGVRIVQYRVKDTEAREMYEEALKLRKICKNVIFLINDRVDIALAVEADGVHLG